MKGGGPRVIEDDDRQVNLSESQEALIGISGPIRKLARDVIGEKNDLSKGGVKYGQSEKSFEERICWGEKTEIKYTVRLLNKDGKHLKLV